MLQLLTLAWSFAVGPALAGMQGLDASAGVAQGPGRGQPGAPTSTIVSAPAGAAAAPAAGAPVAGAPAVASAPLPAGPAAPRACPAPPAPQARCAVESLPVFEGGCAVATVCPDELATKGLTRLDLSNDWAPTIFDEDPSLGEIGMQFYRGIYVKLAAGLVEDPEVDPRAKSDRFLELYGIFPNFTVLRDRLNDDARHACRAAIDDSALDAVAKTVVPWEEPAVQQSRIKSLGWREARLTKEREKRGLATIDELATEKRWAKEVALYRFARTRVDAIRAMQAHLRCDGLLTGDVPDAIFAWGTQTALELYQRKHMLGARALLDAETRQTLTTDSRELDFHAVLRALRERVADADGLLEDGSALGKWGQVLGRDLDSAEFRPALPGVPIEGGAEDAISPATEAAALALGWTSPEATAAWLKGLPEGTLATLHVAVKLPPPPPWHSKQMDIRVEIDRGDVWYTYPVTASGKLRSFPVERRPTTTLYAKHGDREVALVRWPTTIGSWKEEREDDGTIVYKYKNSDVGPRIWRNLIAAPAWIPPPSTPEGDMARNAGGGRVIIKRDVFGPGYASAYGLVMAIHHLPVQRKKELVYFDNGIRSHGSVSYRSILRGNSHGCHRLFNHLAVRVGNFVLHHRSFTREGKLQVGFARSFSYKGVPMTLKINNRGYGYIIDPPIPVNVLEGRIRSGRKTPPAGSMPAP